MRRIKYILIIAFLGTFCESNAQAQKDSWIKTSWNNMVAHYNIYFNAQQKLESCISKLADKQKDDFNSIIDVFPYGSEKEAKSIKEPLEVAMKKVSKVIQNKPNSKWVDDAYFLIGQTQFFGMDFYSSIETFQFVNNSFKDEKTKALSQLWLMKSYIQQKKYDDAEAIYGVLKNTPIKYPDFKTQLNLAAGDLMVKQNKLSEAVTLFNDGLSKLRDKRLRYRTHFVLGQIHLKLNEYEKANINFIKVLKLNAPYQYVFQANLGMAKSTASSNGQGAQKTRKYLKRMLDDEKNKDYFDQIYYELAKLEFRLENESDGLFYMKKSAKNSSNNQIQKTKTYLFLADYYFNNRQYPTAQAYYDSTIAEIPQDYPEVERIKAKHAVLSRLIENIETIKEQDSLLALSYLNRAELYKKINKLVQEIKEKELLAAEEEALRRDQAMLNNNSGGSMPTPNNTGGVWYFYNTSSVARGTNDFNRLWGSRPYGDFWRYLNKSSMSNVLNGSDESITDTESVLDVDTYNSSQDEEQTEALKDVSNDLKKYYVDIPFSATAQLIAKKKIQTAYLDIGKVYFEDLKEDQKAKINFSSLIEEYPKTEYKPEVLFYLTKIALKMGDTLKANQLSKQISDEFPETIYNQVLNNKEIPEDNSDIEVLRIYQDMYFALQEENYNKIIQLKNSIDKNHAGNSIQDKIDYLFAQAIGKTQGRDAYITELKNMKETYQGSSIGELSSYTLRLLQKPEVQAIKSKLFDDDFDDVFYYVITGKTAAEKQVEIKINEFNKKAIGNIPLKVSSLIFGDRSLFYIKQFSVKSLAISYHEEVKSDKQFLLDAGLSNIRYYPITEKNFRKLISNKKEVEYIDQFKSTFVQ